jgi:hypothetical protein
MHQVAGALKLDYASVRFWPSWVETRYDDIFKGRVNIPDLAKNA